MRRITALTMTISWGVVILVGSSLARADLRGQATDATLDSVDVLRIVYSPSDPTATVTTRRTSSRGDCPPEVKAHTDSNFGAGEYTLQAGIEQGESAAVSFTMPASAFPLKLDTAEILFATSGATVSTTTEWSIIVIANTPDSGGVIVAEYSSDGVILPHLEMPPGTTGTIIQFSIAPDDAQQIYIADQGTQSFTVAFRIDAHHSPGTPCLDPPAATLNAFPTTDTSGLASPSGNWIDMVTGAFCLCGEGWTSFQQLPNFCRPSGDWVMRATVTPFDCGSVLGACCRVDGTCTESTSGQCDVIGGTFLGEDTVCGDEPCPEPEGACCVPSTGECVDASEELCGAFGGTWLIGQICSNVVCFPEGACCLADGSCVSNASPESCVAFGGKFQGDGTSCASIECPAPEGWCCTGAGDCFDLEEETCDAFGGTWGGGGTACSDSDACGGGSDCPGDTNGDAVVDVNDVLAVLGAYGTDDPSGDTDGDGDTDVDDILIVISAWGECE
ncbi:MAG: hypothetical protein MK116_04555 [Phycisphaerales bacterium]|nr:hypothetical protein [Phycisphaerales bacterium]